ncbi:MAG TPA: hypothetical protein VGZ48_14390 [Candidatus Acidoferrales bacterium]|jgi:hypothetical protein|nr:hypothetical protein [Candidatus Acidoferrales bacterium]
MPKNPDAKWTVAIRPAAGKPLYKITKIISLNGGGFSILAPYHKAHSGFLFKQPIHPGMFDKAGVHLVSWTDCIGFTAESRAKLSYHVDGFAQFSSENQGTIISGRDPKTGEPKGLAIMARPFSNPATSGPSVGISVWGLEDFEEADQEENLVVFGPGDFYYRLWGPDESNLWQLGVYMFNGVPPVRFDGDQAKMDFALRYPPIAGVVGSIVTLKTIRLEPEKVTLGLYVESLIGAFPSKSGWNMSGPGSWNSKQGGYVLNALYPRDLIPVDQRPSLDYRPSPNNEVNSAPGKNAGLVKRRRKRTHAKSSSRI